MSLFKKTYINSSFEDTCTNVLWIVGYGFWAHDLLIERCHDHLRTLPYSFFSNMLKSFFSVRVATKQRYRFRLIILDQFLLPSQSQSVWGLKTWCWRRRKFRQTVVSTGGDDNLELHEYSFLIWQTKLSVDGRDWKMLETSFVIAIINGNELA